MNAARPTVVITGASGGLGAALATEFLATGWFVVATSRSPLPMPPHEALAWYPLDVTDSERVQHTVDAIVATHGRIDCVVNNAGMARDASLVQLSDDNWDAVLDVNLSGVFRLTRAVARQMAKQRDGSIINISSYSGRAGARGQANYAAAKAGVLGFTQSVARELGSRNVRVNAVLPGVMPTNMTAALEPEQLDAFASANALGRINSLDEVARFVVFLAATRNISGQVFQLDSRIVPWT